jgi:hypothetical protein
MRRPWGPPVPTRPSFTSPGGRKKILNAGGDVDDTLISFFLKTYGEVGAAPHALQGPTPRRPIEGKQCTRQTQQPDLHRTLDSHARLEASAISF